MATYDAFGNVIDENGSYDSYNPEYLDTTLYPDWYSDPSYYDPEYLATTAVGGGLDFSGIDWPNVVPNLVDKFGTTILNTVFKGGKPENGINIAGVGALINMGGGVAEMLGFDIGGGTSGGYNKPVPKMTAVQEAVQYDNTNRRPGQGGRRYFSDVTYVPEGGDTATARTAAQTQAQGIAAAAPSYTPAPTPASETPYVAPWEREASAMRQAPAGPVRGDVSMEMAQIDPATGGLALAAGGQVPKFNGQLQDKGFVVPGDVVRHADPMGKADKERGLQALHKSFGVEAIRGPGDAMSDSIPATIDGKEPARVANGEAYVRPENVARAGGGDVDQGSSRLYEIMDSLRQQRTGSSKQINPDNKQELSAAYGGQIKRFNTGDVVQANTPTAAAAAPSATGIPPDTSVSSSLSPWVGDYVTDFLGEADALAAKPYEAYTGPLTAGESDLQSQAFEGMSNVANTGFTPTNFTTGTFDSAAAQQYMNPYLQASLDPQLKELSRQAKIQSLADSSALTKAGAFGGGRQAIMSSEGNRNLLDKQQDMIATGYSNAYDKAMGQFNAEQGRGLEAQQSTEASRQNSAEFGRQSLLDLANLGGTQRQIEAEGVAADKAQFEEERGWAYQMPQYLKDLLGANLPVGTDTTSENQDWQSQVNQLLAQLGIVLDQPGS